MRNRIIASVVALLTCIGFGIGAAATAQATVTDSDISQNTVHSTAYRVGNGESLRFYGALQAKPGPNGEVKCYLMQYQVADGSWLNGEGTAPGSDDGFWLGENVKVDGILQHCSNELATNRTWIIKVGLKVRGIRFTNGQNTGTHCGPLSATACRNMYQGT
jgi:hypothetical protein